MQQQEPRKKVSVGEALEAMKGQAPPTPSRAASSIVGQGAAYWLESLLEGATRRQTDLYEAIRENPSAQAQMFRRDLRVVGDLSIPSGSMQEVRQPRTPRPPRQGAVGLRERFANVGHLELIEARLESVGAPRQEIPAQNPVDEALRSVSSRFQEVSTLDLAAFYAVEEVGARPAAEARPPAPGTVSLSRFAGVSSMDVLGGIELLEVRQQAADDLPKRRLKTNPNIRKMFQQNSDDLEQP